MSNKPVETLQIIGDVGKYRSNTAVPNNLVRAFMAGLFIAVGGALAAVCSTGIPIPGLKSLVAGSVFPVGLIAIVLTGMSLFTGDTMLVTMGALQKKTTWAKLANTWFWVYIGNFVGSLFWAYLMSVGPLVKGGGTELTAFGVNSIAVAEGKVLPYMAVGAMGLWSAFMKGIACNLLVCTAIMLAATSKNVIGKFFCIWFPIMAFVSSGFEHSVANMYFIPTGIMLGANITVGQFLFWNLLPVTLGNIVGGAFFIAGVYFWCYKEELAAVPKV